MMTILDLPCLAEVPDWANFAAMDASGLIFIYQYEPKCNGTYWMASRLKRLDWAGMSYWYADGFKFWKNSKVELRENIDPKYRLDSQK